MYPCAISAHLLGNLFISLFPARNMVVKINEPKTPFHYETNEEADDGRSAQRQCRMLTYANVC